jgi:hypothetical protein
MNSSIIILYLKLKLYIILLMTQQIDKKLHILMIKKKLKNFILKLILVNIQCIDINLKFLNYISKLYLKKYFLNFTKFLDEHIKLFKHFLNLDKFLYYFSI